MNAFTARFGDLRGRLRPVSSDSRLSGDAALLRFTAVAPRTVRGLWAGSVAAYAIVGLATGGPLSPYRDLIVVPLIVSAFAPAACAAAFVALTLAVAAAPVVADWLVPAAAVLPVPWQAAGEVLLPEISILLMVILGLRLALAGLEARREAAMARRIAEAGAARVAAARARLDTVLRLAERLSETADRAEIFDILASELNRTLGTDASSIRILDGDLLRVVARAGIPDDIAARLPDFHRQDPWFEAVVKSRRPFAIAEIDPTSPEARAYAAYPGTILFRSAIVVPLIHKDEVIGTISAINVRPRDWTDDDLDFASAVATHASIAVRTSELFFRTQAWATQLSVVQAASARMSRQNTVESVGRAIVEETRSMVDYHNCRVYLIEPPGELVPIAFEGRVGAYEKVDLEKLRLKVGDGLTGWVAEHGAPLLIPNAMADPRAQTIVGTDDVDESMVIVPMRYDAQVIGVITLSKLGLAQFNQDHMRLLAILADQAATALESARLLGRSQALALELRQLLAMSSELAQSLDPRQVADLIARHLADSLAVDECAISHWDEPNDRIQTWGYHPSHRREDIDEGYSLSSMPEARRVLAEQVTVQVRSGDAGERRDANGTRDTGENRDIGGNPDAGESRDGGPAVEESTTVMLPLVAKGVSIGLVELISKRAIRFDNVRLELARTMANEAAMALENARLYEAARTLADRDPLTGFLNHRSLYERLGEEVVRAQRSRRPLGLLMLDLDDFKLVNDTFGHQFGDQVLTWAAELIRSTLRASDVPARYGGDEFAVLLPDSDHQAAEATAGRILAAFHDRTYVSDTRGPVPIGVSIGCAAFPGDGRTLHELVAAADGALYKVKKARGRGHRVAIRDRVSRSAVRPPIGIHG